MVNPGQIVDENKEWLWMVLVATWLREERSVSAQGASGPSVANTSSDNNPALCSRIPVRCAPRATLGRTANRPGNIPDLAYLASLPCNIVWEARKLIHLKFQVCGQQKTLQRLSAFSSLCSFPSSEEALSSCSGPEGKSPPCLSLDLKTDTSWSLHICSSLKEGSPSVFSASQIHCMWDNASPDHVQYFLKYCKKVSESDLSMDPSL